MLAVAGENGSVRRKRCHRDDQVVCDSLLSPAVHVREQATVCFSGAEVKWLDRQRFKNPAEKFAARRATRFGREFDPSTQLGDRDRSDD